MDVTMDENKEELNFIPSAVSSSAGLYEPQFVCDRQCREKEVPVLRSCISHGGRRWSAAHKKGKAR